MEDEDGEVVKTYNLPASNSESSGGPKEPTAIEKGMKTMGSWAGLSSKQQPEGTQRPLAAPRSATADNQGAVRQGLKRMGTWGFKGQEKDSTKDAEDDAEDDKHIRFTIGGMGRRLTKEDFLAEMKSLEPKARAEIIRDSDAPAAFKNMAKKDASADSPGTSRIFAGDAQMASSASAAKNVGAKMAKQRGARIEEVEESRSPSGSEGSPRRMPQPRRRETSGLSAQVGESSAERKRREQALKGVDDITPAQRGRSRSRSRSRSVSRGRAGAGGGGGNPDETPAEKRRRLAVMGSQGQEDSDDDDTPRVPPAAKTRGIRFAESPVRGKK